MSSYQISLSLKENLVKVLEDIKAINPALRFIQLLIQAKDAIEKGIKPATCSENDIEINIFIELSSIVTDPEVRDALLKSLQEILCITDDSKPIENLSNLLETTKSESVNHDTSREYLISLIGSVEHLVRICNSSLYHMFRKQKPLFQLLNSIVRLGSIKAQSVLCLITDIFKTNEVNLSCEDKEKIGVLMVGALEHIRSRIKFVPIFCVNVPLVTHLRMRSGLEFIKDNFRDFPVGEERFFKDYMDEISTHISNLDDMLSIYMSDSSDEEDEDGCEAGKNIYLEPDPALEYLRLRMMKEMPLGHTWWKSYKQVNF